MRTVALGDLVDIKGGGTPSKDVEAYWGGDIPWASVKDFKSSEITTTLDSITPEGVANSATNVIPANSILVPTRMAVGKAAINVIPMAINQDLKALTPRNGTDLRYLLHALLAKAPELEKQATGATVKGITLEVLKSLKIPLPPLEEQKRIAAILDQADELRRKRQRALDRLNQLGQAIFHEMFGDPATNPMDWPLTSLAEVCEVNPRNCSNLSDDTPVSFLPMASVSEAGEICDQKERTFGDVKKGFTFFERGDVLLAKITPCFENGKAALTYGLTHSIGFGSTEFHVVRPSEKANADFIFHILHGPKFRIAGASNMTGSAGQRRVPAVFLKEYLIPTPPPELQSAFSKRVNEVAKLKAKTCESLLPYDNLFKSLQQRAFQGEL